MKDAALGKQLKKARIQARFSQLQLAEKCGLDIRTVQRIESGKVFPRLYTLNLINKVLGTDFRVDFNAIKKPNSNFDKLGWKRNVLSANYQIFSNDKSVGGLYNNTISQSGSGVLYDEQFTFKTFGFFRQHTLIFNSNNEQIGAISYNFWMTKARLSFVNSEYHWDYNNLWRTRWRISNADGFLLKYKSSVTQGTIETNTNNELLLLCGLFVPNFFKQLLIVILIMALVPIWALFLS